MTFEEVTQIREVYTALGVGYKILGYINNEYSIETTDIPYNNLEEKERLSVQLLKLQVQEMEDKLK